MATIEEPALQQAEQEGIRASNRSESQILVDLRGLPEFHETNRAHSSY
jgi:hypothetical protein